MCVSHLLSCPLDFLDCDCSVETLNDWKGVVDMRLEGHVCKVVFVNFPKFVV